jgi:rhodanese-related sulfurtransferase
MKPKMILWGIVVVLVVVVGALVLKPAGGIANVDEAGVTAAANQGATVVDVRTPGEFQLGHIPGAVNVPVDQLQAQAQTWDKNATYVVYCATGQRSAIAVDLMKSMGFTSIKHFNAGMQAWTGQVEKGAAAGGEGATGGAKVETSGKPVMIEFFTDS